MSHAIPDVLRTGIAFVVVLGILVFVHELGHYLAARWRGVHVEVFSIGFGRALTSWTDRAGTVWNVSEMTARSVLPIAGTEANDFLQGSSGADMIDGRGGNERGVQSRPRGRPFPPPGRERYRQGRNDLRCRTRSSLLKAR